MSVGQQSTVPALPVANIAAVNSAADKVVAVVGSNTQLLSMDFLVSVKSGNTPANSTSTAINAPSPAWTDGSYLYVAVANGSVKRVALSTF